MFLRQKSMSAIKWTSLFGASTLEVWRVDFFEIFQKVLKNSKVKKWQVMSHRLLKSALVRLA